MEKLLTSIISFFVVFFLVFLYQFLYVIRQTRKSQYKRVPVEVNYMISKFRLDLSSSKIEKVMKESSLVAAFDIAFVYAFITYFIDNTLLCILFSFLLLIPVIIISYNLLGNYYVKKGFNTKKKDK